MTDLDKYKALLDSVGVSYKEEITEGTPSSTLITVQEDYSDNGKVLGYSGFYCYWAFITDTGDFQFIGIYE